jgi:Fe2+ or Zn2+ uptake regulation protein
MRYSKQREFILNALKQNPTHPTADDIYNILKKKYPNLSLGTVYRNLNQLAENGDILRLSGLDGKVHFDHNTFKHCHIICQKCCAVSDIMVSESFFNELKKIKKNSPFEVNGCEIILRGICKKCRKDEQEK